MKRLLAIAAITVFAACGEERKDYNKSDELSDTTTMSSQAAGNASDNQREIRDTTDIASGERGDSTSASGIHGKGSGSRVGGGVTGGPQGKSSDATKKP